MATTPVIDSGRHLGLPPEQQVQTDREFNGTANSRNSSDRSKSTKDREDGGEENGEVLVKTASKEGQQKKEEKLMLLTGPCRPFWKG